MSHNVKTNDSPKFFHALVLNVKTIAYYIAFLWDNNGIVIE